MLRMNFIGVEVVLVFGDNCKHCVKITVAHHFVFNEGETFDLGNFFRLRSKTGSHDFDVFVKRFALCITEFPHYVVIKHFLTSEKPLQAVTAQLLYNFNIENLNGQ